MQPDCSMSAYMVCSRGCHTPPGSGPDLLSCLSHNVQACVASTGLCEWVMYPWKRICRSLREPDTVTSTQFFKSALKLHCHVHLSCTTI